MKVKSESEVAQLCATAWTATYQPPLSMEFSRQEYWSGMPLPSPTVYVGDAKGDTLAVFSLKENSIHTESPSELKRNPQPLILM